MKKKIFLSLCIFLLSQIIFCFSPVLVVADPPTPTPTVKPGVIGCGGGLGPLAEIFCQETPPTKENVAGRFNRTLSALLGFLTTVASLWFMWQFLSAGFQWISAGGDKNQLETARNRMLYGLVGFLIVIAAWVIIALMGKIVGLEILNPGEILLKLEI